MMKSYNKLNVEPYTQWQQGVTSPSSSCGPATMAALAEYWNTRQGKSFIQGYSHFHSQAAHINYIYRHHGGTPWGMSVKGFTKGIKAYISTAFHSEEDRRRLSVNTFNDFELYKQEIDAGRPVAVKFDKWFTLRWIGNYRYDYHWVVGIGYEEALNGEKATLIILDNGAKTADGSIIPSRERRVEYGINKDILTMVALNVE